MKVTEAQLDAAGVDQAWRDYCSHLLIPLNQCRRANLSSPWKCVDERHGYEKCQYEQYVLDLGALLLAYIAGVASSGWWRLWAALVDGLLLWLTCPGSRLVLLPSPCLRCCS